jgi:GDP-D-mannose 3', 5'-epimerase
MGLSREKIVLRRRWFHQRPPKARTSGKHSIEICGDGEQTRSFVHIDGCVKGSRMIMESHVHETIDLGSRELLSINHMVETAEQERVNILA